MSAPRHTLTIVDRGPGHIHRYTATCSCGWVGQHRPTKARAGAMFRHDHAEKRGHQQAYTVRRDVTPADRLPEALR